MRYVRRLSKPTTIFLLIVIAYLSGFFAHALYLQKTVYGDGIFYYSWLHSVAIDRDINFGNEYAFFHVQQPLTTHKLPGNKYSIGPAMLWAPNFVWIQNVIRDHGYAFPNQLAVGITGVLATVAALFILFLTLNKYFSPHISILAILAIAFATNLFFYGSLDTVNSHSLSFFAACFYLSCIFSKKKNPFVIGASLGLLGLIRLQDLAYGILLFPVLGRDTLIPFLCGFLVAFAPQLVAWQMLYGKFWISPYLTGGEGFSLRFSHIVDVLFFPKGGLLFWTPILGLGFAGLYKKWLLLVVVATEILIVASWSTWWQGASYGGRMFVSILPIFAFGLARVFYWLQQKGWKFMYFVLLLIVPLGVLNMLFIVFFLLKT